MAEKVTIKAGSDRQWGIVEKFSTSLYNGILTTKSVHVMNNDLTDKEPQVFKQDQFFGMGAEAKKLADRLKSETSPATLAEGISKYIKAKKPVHTLMASGLFVVQKHRMVNETGEFVSAECILMRPAKNSITDKELLLTPALWGPGYDEEMLTASLEALKYAKGDRARFLLRRIENVRNQ